MLSDLNKQQKIAKDSLRALEHLSDKYDKEKRELVIRLEKEKDDFFRREENKFDQKLSHLRQVNEDLKVKVG